MYRALTPKASARTRLKTQTSSPGRFKVQGSGFRVQGLGACWRLPESWPELGSARSGGDSSTSVSESLDEKTSHVRGTGSGFRVQGSGFRAYGLLRWQTKQLELCLASLSQRLSLTPKTLSYLRSASTAEFAKPRQ